MSLAERVVRHRRIVLAALAVVGAGLGVLAPGLEVRFEPEELVAADERAGLDDDLLPVGEPLVVVLEADDVLAPEALGYLHSVATRLAAVPGVLRVDGPTTTPLPRPASIVEADVDLDSLDLEGPDLLDPTHTAIGVVVASDPARWPLGMISYANEGRRFTLAPLVAAGAVPDDRTSAELADLTARSALVGGRLVARDRRVAVLVAAIAPAASAVETDAVLTAARAATSEPPPGVVVTLSGLPAIRSSMVEALADDQVRLVVLAFGLSLLVLAIGLRSAAGVLLPLGTVGLSVAMSVGGMVLAGEPLNLLTNMIPPLLVTIGLAEAVHMVLRWEETAQTGAPPEKNAAMVLEAMALPCLVTTGTTAIGFGALMLQETSILRHFGAVAAVATMVAYVVTILFVPAGLPSFRPRGVVTQTGREPFLERVLAAIADRASRSSTATIAISAVLFLAALVIARDVTVDSTLMDQFAHGSDVVRTTRTLEAHLDGVRSLEVVLVGEPGRFSTPEGAAELDAVTRWLRDRPGVLRATSMVDWLLEARRLVRGEDAVSADPFHSAAEIDALGRLVAGGEVDLRSTLVAADGARARVEVRLADRGASRILAMIDELEAEVARMPGLEVRCAGEAYLASRGLDRIVRSLGSLGAAVALIFLVMTLLFRSVRLGLLSIPPNALPLAVTLAYMRLRGIPLNAATVIVFTVAIGLAVDGATHVIARFREEAASTHLAVPELVHRTIVSSGRGVVLASATLLLGYGALLVSAFEPVRLFGELSAVAIGGSLVAQLVLLPALLSAFARPRT